MLRGFYELLFVFGQEFCSFTGPAPVGYRIGVNSPPVVASGAAAAAQFASTGRNEEVLSLGHVGRGHPARPVPALTQYPRRRDEAGEGRGLAHDHGTATACPGEAMSYTCLMGYNDYNYGAGHIRLSRDLV